ncbi:S8 family serine peptidase [Kangiella sp.]|uniref:S8 family serine peptidase n=1 Tax=Kangiella sp. TaxID=1920245 RepID=UPI001999289C|nr:S8 family serine peptidase [Kangiella sp.]MBD3654726.1 S8 family serine peptidase [Kangiella sp.]
MSFKVKMACAATLLALGSAAHAERMIVSYDSNGQGLKKGHDVKVEGNGWFAVELDENGKSAIRGQKGFKSMEKDFQRFPMAIYNDDAGDPSAQQLTPYAVYQSQADQLVLQSGQKVCVIDSGIAGGQGETGGKNNDFNWSVITGDSDSGTGDWFTDGGPHGTHVAGTVGAADNGIGVVGMAPGVPMHIIKVFNEAGWGYSSDLAYAAEKCTQAGANIITMSLGGGGANSVEENAFNTFTNSGGLVLAAAGNDGNNVRSYPAGYKSVMMVGANDANNNIASFSQFPSNTVTSGRGKQATTETHDGYGVEVTAGGVDTLSTYPAGGATIASLTVDGVGVPTAATDNTGSVSGATYFMGTAEATDSGANGKICVIDRGNISFADKINNCGNSGGIGAVVINNVAGEGVIYMDITGVTTNIPAVGTAYEDRSAIVGAANASISSGASDYGYMSGTSMATPAVAGVAALVWSNHPTCTGTEIREALKATAEDQGAAGRDDYFGYGIVKAKAASDYITANGCAGGDTTDPTDPTDPPAGDLTASGSRSKGGGQLDLVWSGFSSSNVDITLTSGGTTVLQDTQVNDGAVSYSGADKRATYTVTICESGTTTCAASFDL